MSRHNPRCLVNRRCFVGSLAGLASSREVGPAGMIEVFLDGEVTVTGEPRADFWHPSLVVLSDELGVVGVANVTTDDEPSKLDALAAASEDLFDGSMFDDDIDRQRLERCASLIGMVREAAERMLTTVDA